MDARISKIIFFIPPIALLSALFVSTNFFVMVAVLTSSMEPTVPRGSLVLVAKTSICQVGDIVLYRAFNILVLHRVIEERDGMIKTKGDAAQSPDPWLVPREAIIGRAILIIPFLGEVLFLLKSPLAFASLVTSVYISSSLIHMRRDLAAKIREAYGRIRARLYMKQKNDGEKKET